MGRKVARAPRETRAIIGRIIHRKGLTFSACHRGGL
jgi:hypothetical protein